MLLDSNLVIYSANPAHGPLRLFISANLPALSAVSVVEVFWYHKLSAAERQHFTDLFAILTVLPVSDAVIQQAVVLRQQKKMLLGDSLIAATALVHDRTLLTHNVSDFAWISGLTIIDPLASGSP